MNTANTFENQSVCWNRPVTIAALVIAALTLSACASTPKTKVRTFDTPEVPVNVQQKQPLDIGVYYSDQLRNYRTREQMYKDFDSLVIGKPSIEMFDALLPKLFHSVTPVQSIPLGNGTRAGIDCILEPRVEDVDYPPENGKRSKGHHVTYRFILYRPDGEPISTWTENGYHSSGFFKAGRNMQVAAQELAKSVSSGAAKTGLAHCKSPGTLSNSANGLSATATVMPGDKELEELSFANTRVVVLNVSVNNANNNEMVVHDWAMSLALADGRMLHQPPLYKVISDVHSYKDESMKVAVFINPAFGAISGASTALKMQGVKAQLAGQLQDKIFGERRVKGNVAQSGDVVFELPDKDAKLDGAVLTIWFSDDHKGIAKKLTVPLQGSS